MGKVEQINLAKNTLLVIGQTIIYNSRTVFNGGDISAISVGDELAVSGLINAAGHIVASYIKRFDTQQLPLNAELQGVVSDLNIADQVFYIGGKKVNYAQVQQMDFDSLANGLHVKVMGSESDVLTASRIEVLTVGLMEDVGSLIFVDGLITDLISDTEFSINNTTIVATDNTEFVGGTPKNILAGSRVKVEGKINNNKQVEAIVVEFVVKTNIKIEGVVESANFEANTLTVGGLQISINNSTILLDNSNGAIRKFSLNNISRGDQVKINAIDNGVLITAAWLERTALSVDSTNATNLMTIRGFAAAPISDPLFSVNSVVVDTSGLTDEDGFLDGTLSPITRSVFFDAIQDSSLKSLVEVTGKLNDQTLTAIRAQQLNLGNYTLHSAAVPAVLSGSNDVISVWDGTTNTEADLLNGTTVVNMTITGDFDVIGYPLTVHDVRVFAPGSYSFETCLPDGSSVGGTACDGSISKPLTMTIAPDQVGAHMLFDFGAQKNVDVVMVWARNEEYCYDSSLPKCRLFGISRQGEQLVEGIQGTIWSLTSSDVDGDDVPGAVFVDGGLSGTMQPSFNLNPIKP